MIKLKIAIPLFLYVVLSKTMLFTDNHKLKLFLCEFLCKILIILF